MIANSFFSWTSVSASRIGFPSTAAADELPDELVDALETVFEHFTRQQAERVQLRCVHGPMTRHGPFGATTSAKYSVHPGKSP